MSALEILLAAILLWGHWLPIDASKITVIDESTNPVHAEVYSNAWATPYDDGTCTVHLGKTWRYYNTEDQISVMAHELGHCLGMWWHLCDLDFDTIMCRAQIGAPTIRDHFAMWDHRGVAPYRLIVPITHDGQ